jgi:putative SOS response-associated peptidase YedK
MCGRIVLKSPASQVAAQFDLPAEPPPLEPRHNIAPTQLVLAIRQDDGGGRTAALLQWGLIPPWSPDPTIGAKMFNARSETVADKPAFREAFASRRCIVPADGFYEWRKVGNGRQPHYFSRRDERLLALAGLWERWEYPGGKIIESCSILTTEANRLMRRFHHRMPVILETDDWEPWLATPADGAPALTGRLRPAAESVLRQWPVSTDVGNVANDRPGLLEPLHDDPPDQLNLF